MTPSPIWAGGFFYSASRFCSWISLHRWRIAQHIRCERCISVSCPNRCKIQSVSASRLIVYRFRRASAALGFRPTFIPPFCSRYFCHTIIPCWLSTPQVTPRPIFGLRKSHLLQIDARQPLEAPFGHLLRKRGLLRTVAARSASTAAQSSPGPRTQAALLGLLAVLCGWPTGSACGPHSSSLCRHVVFLGRLCVGRALSTRPPTRARPGVFAQSVIGA